MTFYVVNLNIFIFKVLRFISRKNFCQSCTNILIWRWWSLNQKILSPSNAEDAASVPSPSSFKSRSSLEEQISCLCYHEKVSICRATDLFWFNAFGYCKYSRKATMFFSVMTVSLADQKISGRSGYYQLAKFSRIFCSFGNTL